MTEKQYFREKAISASSLKWFKYSPAYFKKRLDGEIADEKKSFLDLGRKIHMAILEPEEFEKNYIYLDYQTPKSAQQKQFCETYVEEHKKHPKSTKISCKLKAYKKAYNTKGKADEELKKKAMSLHRKLRDYIDYLEKSSEYKDVLTKAEWDLINELKEAVYEHKAALEVLTLSKGDEALYGQISAYSELPIFWVYPVDYEDIQIECKSMIDRLVIDKENKIIKLIDLKTTSTIGEFKDKVDEYKYYRQLAFYWMAVYAAIKKGEIDIDNIDEYDKQTYIIALQKRDIPECRVHPIPEVKLNEGLAEIDRLIPEIAWHLKNDKWTHSKQYYEGNGIENLY